MKSNFKETQNEKEWQNAAMLRTKPNWLHRQHWDLLIIPLVIVLFMAISCSNKGNKPQATGEQSTTPCVGWECDGSYFATNDTTVRLFGTSYFVKKGNEVIVNKGLVDMKTGTSSPEAAIAEVDTKNKNITDCAFQPVYPNDSESVLKGVVELGATGFNYFIIRMNSRKEWKQEKAKYGWSLAYEKMSSEDLIHATLKDYIGEILNFGVNPKNVHFVVSSGANKEDNVQKIIKILKDKVGYVVNIVSPEQEAKYGLKCILPKEYENTGFVVDIGSSNTKVAWLEADKVVGIELQGAKYKQREISDEEVQNDILEKVKGLPSKNTAICFIMGGIPYELAKQDRVEKERYTCLKSPNAYSAVGDKQIGGNNIYDAIRSSTDCKQFVFDWEANFSIGFLLSL